MSAPTLSAESRLSRLLDRLLSAAEASLAVNDLEPARSAAEEVRAVDPDNRRADQVLRRVSARQVGPTGERALVSLLFADLVGSTLLSERLEPEQLRDLYAVYRTAAREAVGRYSGSVLQYVGDGILAGFGHPEPHEDDARRAVLAGLDLVTALRDARVDLERRFGVAPEVRVGVHTGRVVVTDLSADGSVAERDSIVGLVPNLAARIQQAAAPGTVVISDVTQHLVEPDFYLQSLGEQQLKGITRPVEVFAVSRPRYAAARFEAARYRQAGLVGRAEPRERLLAAWSGVREGRGGSTVLVVGEAGIGKSRLVAEVVDRVEASGGGVLAAACLPYHVNVSLWPVARMLERMLGVADEPAARLPALTEHLSGLGLDPGEWMPFLGPLVGVPPSPEHPAPELEPSAFLEETLDRLTSWLTVVTERVPHLLVLEDLHWSDPSTLELLGRLAGRRPAGLLTLATSREAGAVPWREAIPVVELRRLDPDAAAELIGNLTAGHELEDAARAAIVAHADGVPLFLEELTRSQLDATGGEPVPLRLQELFTWRFKAPGVDLRTVQVAATVGSTFDAGTLSAVLGEDRAVGEQLQVLTDAGILEPIGPEGRYRFRHALMRDAAYETQVLDVRRSRHARVADVLTERAAEPALIAQHLDLAGQADHAAGLYLVAAQAQHGRGAHAEATRLVSRALELLETLPSSDERDLDELAARMLRGVVISAVQGYASPLVQSDHRRAEDLASRLGRQEVLPALIALWSYWLTSGALDEAAGLIDRLGRTVVRPPFAWFEPEVAACAGVQDFFSGRLRSAPAHLDRALAAFDARPPDRTVSQVWSLPHDPIAGSAVTLACVGALRGEPDTCRRWEEKAVRRSEGMGFPRGPFSLAFVTIFRAWIQRFLGNDEAAQQLGAEVVAIGQEHGYVLWTVLGSCYAATATPAGDPDRAFVEQSIAGLRQTGFEAFAAANLAYLARLHAGAGELDQADRWTAQALEVARTSGEHVHLPELLRQRAGLTLARDEHPAEAVTDLTEALRLATDQGARVSRLRAALDLARLPDAHRPAGWRSALSDARTDLPGPWPGDETAAADALLGG